MDYIPSKEDALKLMGKVIVNVIIMPFLIFNLYMEKLIEAIFPTFKENEG